MTEFENILDVSISNISVISDTSFISQNDYDLELGNKLEFDDLECQNYESNTYVNQNTQTTQTILDSDNLDSTNFSSGLENFIESISDMLSKSQYVLYNLNGTKMYLEKHEVVYESDENGNRQYYLAKDETPLFQNPDMIIEYIKNNI